MQKVFIFSIERSFIRKSIFVVCVVMAFFGIFQFTPRSARAATDPIAHWKFDDGSGTAPVDSSGNSITGSFLTPNPTWSTDVPSAITFNDPYSLDFTGTHDGVTFAWPAGLNFAATAPRSFSFWYKPVADGEADAGEYDRIISWDSDQFEIAGTTGSKSNHTISYYDGSWNSTSLTLTLGTWYHITFTYNGTTAKFYIDNDEKDSHSLGGRALSGTMAIGTRQNGHNEGINGKIDDVRVYDYALSPTQVQNITAGSNNPDAPPASPTPTPSASPSTTTTSNSTSGATAPETCTKPVPSSAPDLFQISTALSRATVFFTPVSPATGYLINYGRTNDANEYSVKFDYADKSGSIPYTINNLSQNTRYYFKVQAFNNCSYGSWSSTRSESTTTTAPSTSKKSTNTLTLAIASPRPSATPSPTPSPSTITLLVSPSPAASSPTPLQSPLLKDDGYNISIKMVNDGKPVSGATVEIHSEPMRTVTDKDGLARFVGVERGQHTISIVYQDYSGEEKLGIDGSQKDLIISLSIELKPNSVKPMLLGVGVGSGIILFLLLLLFLWKKGTKKTEPTHG